MCEYLILRILKTKSIMLTTHSLNEWVLNSCSLYSLVFADVTSAGPGAGRLGAVPGRVSPGLQSPGGFVLTTGTAPCHVVPLDFFVAINV